MDYIITIILVSFSGLFSGLTLGLLSLDKAELKRKISLGDKKAEKVYAVRKHGNLLLCTLLLGNVAVNSTLAIFLGSIASGFIGGVIATGLIVIFGEIVPQASISRYALAVGAQTAWIVKVFIYILFPVCFPIAWILDKALGDEMSTIYSKKELMKIVEEHEGSQQSSVDADEKRIISGALSFSDKTAEQVMTPRTVVYALSLEQVLSQSVLNTIKNKGFTRIPVYEDSIDNVVGLIFAKDLIGLPAHKTVSDIYRKKFQIINKDMRLDDLLNVFIQTKTHLAVVRDEFGGTSGVITLEDVIEEVLSTEIVDEDDKIIDMQALALEKMKK